MVHSVPTLTIEQLLAQKSGSRTQDFQAYVTCPLDPNHRMPEHRLSWHLLNRCQIARERKLYHCKNDFSHIYVT